MGSRMSALRDLQIVNIYDQIRKVQEASFQKYGSYAHAAGFLGVWLEGAADDGRENTADAGRT